jgi:predicted ester cyclase
VGDTAALGPREVVGKYIRDVLNRRDLAAVDQLIGNENLKQRVSAFLLAFPDLEVTVHKLVCEGDIVASHLSATGRSWAASA